MKLLLLFLSFTVVLSLGGYVGHQWGEKQAFLHFAEGYYKNCYDLDQTVRRQAPYLKASGWGNEQFLKRRWDLLNQWGDVLISIDRRLHLNTELAQAIKEHRAKKIDFTNLENMKLFLLEINHLLKRLPPSQWPLSTKTMIYVAPELQMLSRLIEENNRLYFIFYQKINVFESAFTAKPF